MRTTHARFWAGFAATALLVSAPAVWARYRVIDGHSCTSTPAAAGWQHQDCPVITGSDFDYSTISNDYFDLWTADTNWTVTACRQSYVGTYTCGPSNWGTNYGTGDLDLVVDISTFKAGSLYDYRYFETYNAVGNVKVHGSYVGNTQP